MIIKRTPRYVYTVSRIIRSEMERGETRMCIASREEKLRIFFDVISRTVARSDRIFSFANYAKEIRITRLYIRY